MHTGEALSRSGGSGNPTLFSSALKKTKDTDQQNRPVGSVTAREHGWCLWKIALAGGAASGLAAAASSADSTRICLWSLAGAVVAPVMCRLLSSLDHASKRSEFLSTCCEYRFNQLERYGELLKTRHEKIAWGTAQEMLPLANIVDMYIGSSMHDPERTYSDKPMIFYELASGIAWIAMKNSGQKYGMELNRLLMQSYCLILGDASPLQSTQQPEVLEVADIKLSNPGYMLSDLNNMVPGYYFLHQGGQCILRVNENTKGGANDQVCRYNFFLPLIMIELKIEDTDEMLSMIKLFIANPDKQAFAKLENDNLLRCVSTGSSASDLKPEN